MPRHPYPGSLMRPPPRQRLTPLFDWETEFEFEWEQEATPANTCRVGEGPPASVPDPEGKGTHPLVYRGVAPVRSRNPSVGYAQQLLNIFLDQLQRKAFPCKSPGSAAFLTRSMAQLKAQGQLPLAVDCRFGPATQLATKMFQVCVGPPLVPAGGVPDGKIGPITWPRLEALAPKPVKPPKPKPTPAVCPPATCTPPRAFRPSLHGFRFTNSFSLSGWSVLSSLPSVISRLFSGRFGLCGGMSAGALDYFLSCVTIPSTSSPPGVGDPLFDFLGQRQLDSLEFPPGARLVAKFLEWTNLPDDSVGAFGVTAVRGLRERTVDELTDTLAKLRAGERVPLGLIYVGPGTPAIWENHQVLVYESVAVNSTTTDLRIYDPNHPGNDNIAIRCVLNSSGDRVDCEELSSGTKIEDVRGFFVMPYKRAVPPCIP